MNLGGIGDNHSSDMHQITKCMHDHNNSMEGKMKTLTQPGAATQQTLKVHQEQTTQLSLTDMLQQLRRSLGQRLLGFWNGSDAGVSGQNEEKAPSASTMAQVSSEDDTGVINAAKQTQAIQNSPYFAAIAETPRAVHPTLGQRIKIKFKGVASQLANHLPGRFFNFEKKGSFQAKKEGSKEDLRKRSKYREDTLEIDCVLTDESYLMDSYDRKGEYRQLTTNK